VKRASSLYRWQARWWTSTSTRAVAISVVFGALIVIAAFAASERLARFGFVQWSGGGTLPGRAMASEKSTRLLGFAELGPGDPAVRFSETHVGHVLFASARSDNCQRLLFDNRTGLLYEAQEIFCGDRPDQDAGIANLDRLTGLRQAFRR